MRSWKILLAAPLLVGLAGCVEDGYAGVQSAYYDPYPYNGWYDGFYGPIYDGYWGDDGFFYYRATDRDRHFHRGNHDHFRRGDARPTGSFRPMQGTFTPPSGYRMPHYPKSRH
ncbi:MAG TPA: hypothetical protein VJQ77_08475 [Novosphingobium sp.]|nr:hypothetical protein [Novosphingobium sp.]